MAEIVDLSSIMDLKSASVLNSNDVRASATCPLRASALPNIDDNFSLWLTRA